MKLRIDAEKEEILKHVRLEQCIERKRCYTFESMLSQCCYFAKRENAR
jgi:hypothetical protein